MAESRPAAAHAAHDLLLVAALADRELTGTEHDRARSQVDTCAECASLHADLVSLARATQTLPQLSRPRDFTLRPEDAQRLRPNLLRRILGSFGTARDGISRPLAMGFTTLGLAGLIVGAVPGALPTSTAGTAEDTSQRLEVMSAAPAPAGDLTQRADGGPAESPTTQFANPAPGTNAPGASAASGLAGGEVDREDDTADVANEPADDPTVALAPDPTGLSLPIVLSGTLLILGLGLFAMRWSARRFGG